MIKLEKVTKIYPGSSMAAVNNVDLKVPEGEICVMIGSSGSGKTTLMRMINKLIPITSGFITIGDQNIMATDPPVMLMDEPFGAIAPINREVLQDEFLKIQSQIKKTIVFVTHDIHEAIKMGDKIALLDAGRLIQYGTPEELLTAPKNQFVKDFVGADRALKRLTFMHVEDAMPGLLYKALVDKQVDVAMGFATDGRIKGFDLVVLQDDQQYFPVYNPAPVVKKEIAAKYPELDKIFAALAEKLDTQTMTDLNYAVDGAHKSVADVDGEWLKSVGLI